MSRPESLDAQTVLPWITQPGYRNPLFGFTNWNVYVDAEDEGGERRVCECYSRADAELIVRLHNDFVAGEGR